MNDSAYSWESNTTLNARIKITLVCAQRRDHLKVAMKPDCSHYINNPLQHWSTKAIDSLQSLVKQDCMTLDEREKVSTLTLLFLEHVPFFYLHEEHIVITNAINQRTLPLQDLTHNSKDSNGPEGHQRPSSRNQTMTIVFYTSLATLEHNTRWVTVSVSSIPNTSSTH